MIDVKDGRLIIDGIHPEHLVEEFGTPLYIYDKETILTRYRQLYQGLKSQNVRIYYAAKANTNISIMRILRKEGAYINTASPGEIFLALEAGFKPNHILFTGDNLPIADMEYAISNEILLNIDSLSQLKQYCKLNPKSKITLRVNPGIGAGFHDHAITAGPQSKFGINPTDLEQAQVIAKKANITIIGLHMHIGSGILNTDPLLGAADILLNLATEFEELKFINFGGGIGIPYKPDEVQFGIEVFCKLLTEKITNWTNEYGKQLIFAIEPGKYLVAEAGILLTRITAIKQKNQKKLIGVDTGFNHLIRPALYNAYHDIIVIQKVNAPQEWNVDIVGYLCENSDYFARDRPFPVVYENDLLAVMNAGAYGFTMASNYNSRLLPAEVPISNGKAAIIRRRQELDDLLRYQCD